MFGRIRPSVGSRANSRACFPPHVRRASLLLDYGERFYGAEAANLDRRKYFQLMWRERARMRHFLDWVDERDRAQRIGGV
jgi:hypothetical protein